MVSKSFCLDDIQVDTKNLPITLDQQPMTPQVYRSFQTNQGKEFLQLYIKARSQNRDGKPKHKPRSQHNSDKGKNDTNNENKYNIASEPHSPNIEGNSLRRKAILGHVDTNYMPKESMSEKPSKFKLSHQAEKLNNEQYEEGRSFSFKLDHSNNESLHYIESKEIIEPNQGPTSMEILLPARNDTQVRESYALDVQNTNRQETIHEQEQEQEHGQEQENQQQQHQQTETRAEDQTHNEFRAIEIASNPSTNRVTFNPHIEKTFYKIFKIYAFIFVSYGTLLGISFGIFPYYIAFLLAWGIEAYVLYENYVQASEQYDPSTSRERINFCFQVASLAIFQTLGLLRLSGLNFPLSLGMICNILVLVVSCYLMNSRNARDSTKVSTLFQTLLTIQLMTICLKVDGVIQWNWSGVFWISWAVLAVVAFYCFGLFILFASSLCIDNSRNYQLVGLLWVLAGLCGCTATFFTLLLGFTNKLETEDRQNLVQFALLGGLGHVAFMTLLTLITKIQIKRFLNNIIRFEPQRVEDSTPEVRFERDNEGLPPYIISFTPSYFLTFAQSLKDKDGTKLRNTKKKLSITKSCQYRRTRSELSLKPYLLQYATEKIYSPSINKVKQMFTFNNNQAEAKTPLNFKPKQKIFASEAKRKPQKLEEDLNTLPELDNEKLCFSANDMDFIKRVEVCDFLADVKAPITPLTTKRASEKDEDKACIICFDKFPDAVIMGCGHGGICYGCALESWKKSQECFMCRGKIEKVLHIDRNQTGKLNIRKVLSATKLAKNRPADELYGHEENLTRSLYAARNHL